MSQTEQGRVRKEAVDAVTGQAPSSTSDRVHEALRLYLRGSLYELGRPEGPGRMHRKPSDGSGSAHEPS
jgi:hypothetical protein